MTRRRKAEMSADEYRERVTEDQMERTVLDLVKMRNGRLFHVRRADVAPELVDLPDWFILDPMGQRALLIEAKSQKRIITAGQSAVLAMAAECTRFESGIVRPNPKPGEIGYDEFLAWLEGRR